MKMAAGAAARLEITTLSFPRALLPVVAVVMTTKITIGWMSLPAPMGIHFPRAAGWVAMFIWANGWSWAAGRASGWAVVLRLKSFTRRLAPWFAISRTCLWPTTLRLVRACFRGYLSCFTISAPHVWGWRS